MKGIIFYNSNRENAIKEMEKIIKKYEQIKIKSVRYIYNSYQCLTEFENGDIWKIVKANDSARGDRCNVAYIERSIYYDTYHCIIAPMMTALPFSALCLWSDGDLYLTDEYPISLLF